MLKVSEPTIICIERGLYVKGFTLYLLIRKKKNRLLKRKVSDYQYSTLNCRTTIRVGLNNRSSQTVQWVQQCRKRDAHINWSMVIPSKAAPVCSRVLVWINRVRLPILLVVS